MSVANIPVRKKKSEFAKYPTGDKTILIVAYVILGIFLIAIILPVLYIVLASFIDPITLQNKGVTFDFSKWTATAYSRVLGNKQIWVGFKNALIYSVLFTIISVIVTLLAAYPMSRADFRFKKFFNTSGLIYREQKLSQKIPTMTDDEIFALLATNGMLVKRPLVVGDDFVLTGFKEKEWDAVFKK